MARKVIKSSSPVTSSTHNPSLGERKVIEREIFAAQQRADEIKQVAEQQAEERRARGAEEAEAVYQETHKLGAAEGMDAAASAVLEGFWRRAEALRQATADCIVIGRHICSKFVGRPLTLGDVEARNIADAVIQTTIEKRKVKATFSPSDWQALEERDPLLLQALGEMPELNLEPNPDTPEGLATLHVPRGDFNAGLDGVVEGFRKLFDLPEARVNAEPQVLQSAPVPPMRRRPKQTRDSAVTDDPFAAPDEDVPRDTAPGDILPAEDLDEEEPAQYRDISNLVAEIDAEDEDD